MNRISTYLTITLWRAICKIIAIVILAGYWIANPSSEVAAALFAGAAVLWVLDGIDHGIDAIRTSRAKSQPT